MSANSLQVQSLSRVPDPAATPLPVGQAVQEDSVFPAELQ